METVKVVISVVHWTDDLPRFVVCVWDRSKYLRQIGTTFFYKRGDTGMQQLRHAQAVAFASGYGECIKDSNTALMIDVSVETSIMNEREQ